MKTERKKIAEHNGDKEAAKKELSAASMRSQKAASRIELFAQLRNEGDEYLTQFDVSLTFKVMDIKEIHSDEECEIVGGVKTRKRRRPVYRDDYPLVNDLFSYLNTHTKYNVTRVEGSPKPSALKDNHRILLRSFSEMDIQPISIDENESSSENE
jgi:hypothetical protein